MIKNILNALVFLGFFILIYGIDILEIKNTQWVQNLIDGIYYVQYSFKNTNNPVLVNNQITYLAYIPKFFLATLKPERTQYLGYTYLVVYIVFGIILSNFLEIFTKNEIDALLLTLSILSSPFLLYILNNNQKYIYLSIIFIFYLRFKDIKFQHQLKYINVFFILFLIIFIILILAVFYKNFVWKSIEAFGFLPLLVLFPLFNDNKRYFFAFIFFASLIFYMPTWQKYHNYYSFEMAEERFFQDNSKSEQFWEMVNRTYSRSRIIDGASPSVLLSELQVSGECIPNYKCYKWDPKIAYFFSDENLPEAMNFLRRGGDVLVRIDGENILLPNCGMNELCRNKTAQYEIHPANRDLLAAFYSAKIKGPKLSPQDLIYRTSFEGYSWGWGSQEPWGSWSISDKATLFIPLNQAIENKFIKLKFQPFLNETHPEQRVIFFINSEFYELKIFEESKPSEIQINISKGMILNGYVVVKLILLDSIEPYKIDPKSKDARKIALGLLSISYD